MASGKNLNMSSSLSLSNVNEDSFLKSLKIQNEKLRDLIKVFEEQNKKLMDLSEILIKKEIRFKSLSEDKSSFALDEIKYSMECSEESL